MATEKAGSTADFDVIVVGAGISGVACAYRVQQGLPGYSYTVLEGRSEMGGTWSLFKFPGIRSDSDLFTFGFPFDPWTEDRAIADGPSILKYIKEVSARHGIDKHIRYGHQVQSMNWSSKQQRWSMEVLVNGTEKKTFTAKYIELGTGYYNYGQGLEAKIPGLENFKGKVVHPQFWPEDLNYEDKKVVIVGSGATAVTILPAMTDGAAKVTMLQRSPGYFIELPMVEPIDTFIRKIFPTSIAFQIIRMRFLVLGFLFFQFCRMFPNAATKALQKDISKSLPKNVPMDPHFTPLYRPWDQRMCITPSGDFFKALHTGKADVVTDHIENVTESQIKLKSGSTLDADIIVTATGLQIQLLGGIKVTVDQTPFDLGQKFVWKGALLQDLPNACFVFGYTNASWTPGADATANLFVRIMQTAKSRGMTSVVPRLDKPDSVKEVPILNLNSTYIKNAIATSTVPKGGDVAPWKPRNNYFQDYWNAKWGDITTGLQFYRVTVP